MVDSDVFVGPQTEVMVLFDNTNADDVQLRTKKFCHTTFASGKNQVPTKPGTSCNMVVMEKMKQLTLKTW